MGLKMFFLGFLFLNGLLLCMAQADRSHRPPPTPPSHRQSSTPPSPRRSPSTPRPPPVRSTVSAGSGTAGDPLQFHVRNDTSFAGLCNNTKTMVMVNGKFPGPPIEVSKNQNETVSIFVNVFNEVGNEEFGITIHWHGVKQPRNPWSDGPEHIAQCPIKSNKNYTQEIVLTDEVGTLWWHAHSDWSRATVHGAIIIKPKGFNYPYRPLPDPDEKTIIIASWYNGNVEDESEKARNLLGPAPSDAYTINGHAGNCFRDCEANVSVISVESNKTYLLHIVNAVLNEEMFFAIDDHNLTVVAMDGAYVAPITFPYIMLGPGNTMDVLLTTKNESTTNYYMAAGYYHSGGPDPLTLSATALLQYKSDSVMPTCSADFLPTHEDFDKAENFTNSIKSKDPQVVPPMTPGRQYVIEIAAYGPNTFNPPSRSSLSNISYVFPNNTSVLQAAVSCIKGGKCNDSLDYNATFPHNQSEYGPTLHGNSVILLEYADVVDIVFQGTSRGAETHPMHVHGYSFFLLGRNYSTFNNNSLINTVNPPVLNTVSVPTNGWAAIRFKADNPATGMVHPLSFGAARHLGYGHSSDSEGGQQCDHADRTQWTCLIVLISLHEVLVFGNLLMRY